MVARRAVLLFAMFAVFVACRRSPGVSLPVAPLPKKVAVAPGVATIAPFVAPRIPSAEDDERLAGLDPIVQRALDEGKMPGCVLVIGRREEILSKRAYGSRSVLPARTPMTLDTVFDLASLTKPIATASSLMVLVDRKRVDLDAPASRYVPELSKLAPFTVRQLLVHTSGLPAATAVSDFELDRAALMRRIGDLTLKSKPGERFVYSDVGYVVLEEIVRRASGTDLATFATREIFEPLGMRETRFSPDDALRARAAPTEIRDGAWIQGVVHDPRAFALHGVAGHAGLFSTADDLARFAQSMLARGATGQGRWVSDATFRTFLTRQETPGGGRALGWDIDSRFATHKGALFSSHAFGHGGFTGTAMWIDPDRDLFVVFLSNRVHPDGKGAVNPLIGEVSTEIVRATDVSTGIDVLRAESFEPLRGLHVGLITNAGARARDGMSTADAFRNAPAVKLDALFVPEHGMGAEREGNIGDGSYQGIPVYSLFGDRFSPTATMLDGLDALVFDLQDAGTRFYTYASTMKRAMKVAAERKMRFLVLDRPNPLDGIDVDGPVLTATGNFVNHHALPVRHGMTMGELAGLFVADEGFTVNLEVVRMHGWRRKDYFDHTGLAWTSPSPNLRSVASVVLYPALGLLEGTNVSVGRGTDAPFEVLGAPWLDGEALTTKLRAMSVPGVTFEPTRFLPQSSMYRGKDCTGIRIRVTDRAHYEPVRTAISIAIALREIHPRTWEFEHVDRLLQSKAAMDAIRDGRSIADIEATWTSDLARWKTRREQFLLYR